MHSHTPGSPSTEIILFHEEIMRNSRRHILRIMEREQNTVSFAPFSSKKWMLFHCWSDPRQEDEAISQHVGTK